MNFLQQKQKNMNFLQQKQKNMNFLRYIIHKIFPPTPSNYDNIFEPREPENIIYACDKPREPEFDENIIYACDKPREPSKPSEPKLNFIIY